MRERLTQSKQPLTWEEILKASRFPSQRYFLLQTKKGKFIFGKPSQNSNSLVFFYRIINIDREVIVEASEKSILNLGKSDIESGELKLYEISINELRENFRNKVETTLR